MWNLPNSVLVTMQIGFLATEAKVFVQAAWGCSLH